MSMRVKDVEEPEHHTTNSGGGGVGMKRGSALSHAIPNAKNKMRRKEHELL
jgi:hypothetical protein